MYTEARRKRMIARWEPVCAACLALAAPIAVGAGSPVQEAGNQPRPAFEVASVKPDPPLPPSAPPIPPSALRHVLSPPVGNRFSTRRAPLGLLIQYAYGVQSFQMTGGPEWINSTGYAVEASAAGSPARGQIWRMLQSLLEDRFHLKVHRETREMPVHVLTVAKGGAKLSTAPGGDCIEPPSADGQRPLVPCGLVTVSADTATGLSIVGRQVTMVDLVNQLAAILRRPIIDRTELAGKFDINLRFAYDPDFTAGIPNPWGLAPDPGTNPPITAAITQQLGLRLEAAKGTVEVLVIDHVERPSEN